MLSPRPLAGPMQPIRLADVPLHIRRRFGRRLIDQAGDDLDLLLAAQLTAAVECPSDRIYWVLSEAAEKVIKAEKKAQRVAKPRDDDEWAPPLSALGLG